MGNLINFSLLILSFVSFYAFSFFNDVGLGISMHIKLTNKSVMLFTTQISKTIKINVKLTSEVINLSKNIIDIPLFHTFHSDTMHATKCGIFTTHGASHCW